MFTVIDSVRVCKLSSIIEYLRTIRNVMIVRGVEVLFISSSSKLVFVFEVIFIRNLWVIAIANLRINERVIRIVSALA